MISTPVKCRRTHVALPHTDVPRNDVVYGGDVFVCAYMRVVLEPLLVPILMILAPITWLLNSFFRILDYLNISLLRFPLLF